MSERPIWRYKQLRKPPKSRVWRSRVNLIEAEWQDLTPLLKHAPHLRSILINTTVEDISTLDQFEHLEELSISLRAAGELDLARLPRLQDFWLDVGPERRVTPGGGEQLRRLGLYGATRPWAEWICTLPQLGSLRLDYPRSLPQRLPTTLRCRSLAGGRRWSETVCPFEGGDQLEELSLHDIRGMVDLTHFHNVQNLRSLYLEDCPDLHCLDGPALAPDCEIILVGRTPKLA